jgi:probable F420-dependent oxidoreductase
MQIGIVFPQIESGNDPLFIRDFAQAAEGLGFSHILAYDHVLGADLTNRPDWSGPYNSSHTFHEPFVLFAYMAALTTRIGFVPGVIILPQRQTALVAKQAAALDLLSGGRLRLGVGIGWNAVEYEALGMNFRDRGARSDEQLEVLRLLLSEPVVTYQGSWHTISEAGINPLPAQRPLPLWIGGYQDVTLQRVARRADGWIPFLPPDDRAQTMLERLRELTIAAGRDPNQIGIEAQLSFARVPATERERYVAGWQQLGATHLCVNLMGQGLTPHEHLAQLRVVAEQLGVQP